MHSLEGKVRFTSFTLHCTPASINMQCGRCDSRLRDEQQLCFYAKTEREGAKSIAKSVKQHWCEVHQSASYVHIETRASFRGDTPVSDLPTSTSAIPHNSTSSGGSSGQLSVLQENEYYNLPPSSVFFSHNEISCRFRAGMHVDDAIEAIESGQLAAVAFPAVDTIQLDDKVVVIRYVHRVCASRGVLRTIREKLHSVAAPDMQKVRWDENLGRLASKYERSMSSSNGGTWVRVRSRYENDQAAIFNSGAIALLTSTVSPHRRYRQASASKSRQTLVARSPRAASEEAHCSDIISDGAFAPELALTMQSQVLSSGSIWPSESNSLVWKRYYDESGYWWWRNQREWFLERRPGDWQQFRDPDSELLYWWHPDGRRFWIHNRPQIH